MSCGVPAMVARRSHQSGRDDHDEAPADQVGGRPAEQGRGGRVDVRDAVSVVADDDRVAELVEQRTVGDVRLGGRVLRLVDDERRPRSRGTAAALGDDFAEPPSPAASHLGQRGRGQQLTAAGQLVGLLQHCQQQATGFGVRGADHTDQVGGLLAGVVSGPQAGVQLLDHDLGDRAGRGATRGRAQRQQGVLAQQRLVVLLHGAVQRDRHPEQADPDTALVGSRAFGLSFGSDVAVVGSRRRGVGRRGLAHWALGCLTELEPDHLAVWARFHAPAAGQHLDQFQPAAGGRVSAEAAGGRQHRAAIAHLDADNRGSGGDPDADRRAAVQHGISHQLADQQLGGVAVALVAELMEGRTDEPAGLTGAARLGRQQGMDGHLQTSCGSQQLVPASFAYRFIVRQRRQGQPVASLDPPPYGALPQGCRRAGTGGDECR
jgi:hypothetical protein